MEIKEREIEGVFEISLKPIEDDRGFFMRVFDYDIFENIGINRKWVQENHSRSQKKGIIRGLHFQLPPYTEAKLVRCIKGEVLDVFVDLRMGSNTFGNWGSIKLSEENKKMILLPRGLAHGFCTQTEISEVLYKVDNYYSKEHERGLIWNDVDLKIDWRIDEPILSAKDKANLALKEFLNEYTGIKL